MKWADGPTVVELMAMCTGVDERPDAFSAERHVSVQAFAAARLCAGPATTLRDVEALMDVTAYPQRLAHGVAVPVLDDLASVVRCVQTVRDGDDDCDDDVIFEPDGATTRRRLRLEAELDRLFTLVESPAQLRLVRRLVCDAGDSGVVLELAAAIDAAALIID